MRRRICGIVDFAERDTPRRTLLFADPVAILEARMADDVPGVLERVDRARTEGLHAVGFVSYDAAGGLDPSLRTAHPSHAPTDLPCAWFALTRAPTQIDLADRCEEPFALSKLTPSTSRAEYERAHSTILEQIESGALYQLNYTFRLRGRFDGDDLALYRTLRDAQTWGQSARYSAYLNLGRWRLLSASPELFFRREGNTLEVRPMKGTSKRGRWLEEDDAMAAGLRESPKERAENVMITDLMRNDLGKIAEVGSVRVREQCAIERYPTLLQMTTTVIAAIPPETTLLTTFRSLFPSGSITGAPKRAAVHAIRDLESDARNAYCGAIGVVSPQGDAVFNVAIRTLALDALTGEAEYGVGGGITIDSNVTGEYQEAMLKARVVTTKKREMQLIETLRLQDGELVRGDQHLGRMSASARYFGFVDPLYHARDAAHYAAHSHPVGTYRLRLLASPNGSVVADPQPCPVPYWSPVATATPEVAARDPRAPTTRLVGIACRAVSEENVLLYHKTTDREIYDAHQAEQHGMWDILLWNTRREVTEFTIGNLVFEWNGELCTPPRDCGLLAGVLRGEELARGRIRERCLLLDDLARVKFLWLINSFRGWVPVRLVS